MGRNSKQPCLDGKRCRVCHSDLCTFLIEQKQRLTCYHTEGIDGVYVRRHQMDYMDICGSDGDFCSFQLKADGSVKRGCAANTTAQVDGLQLCSTDLCNRQLGGIYCFKCQPTDPNCVFSQHEGPFALCRPPEHRGCYTRVFADSSVERGCGAVTWDNTTLGSVYHFCDGASLCNGETTKSHSCHFLQLNVAFRPLTPVPHEHWQRPTHTGWMFESCPDSEGLPACYMKTGYKVLTYGCTRDLTDYDLVTYQRGSLFFALNFCDGHYCNLLPESKDPTLDAN